MSNDSAYNMQLSIILTLVIVMILAPMGLVFYFFEGSRFWYVQIMAMSWFANIEAGNLHFILDPTMIFTTLHFSFMRIGFVYMIWRAYQGKTTKSRVLRIGIAMEFWFSLLYYLPNLISLLLFPMNFMFWPLAIPIPFLLFIGWILLRLRPPAEMISTWVDEEQPEQWWEANNQ